MLVYLKTLNSLIIESKSDFYCIILSHRAQKLKMKIILVSIVRLTTLVVPRISLFYIGYKFCYEI